MMHECGAKRQGECRVALPSELLSRVADALNDLEIEYFITGSVASSAYGEYRATADVDVVARIAERHVPLLLATFRPDRYYVDEAAMRQAIRTCGQFIIIDTESAFKADIVIPNPSAFNTSRMARARRIPLGGQQRLYWFASPEDVILKKLEYFRDGQFDKHLRDVSGILKAMGDRIDRTYIENWTSQLGTTDIWRAVVQRVESQ